MRLTYQEPIGMDDYGWGIYECRYTRHAVTAENGVVIGATVPGVKAKYIMAQTPEAKEAQKESGIAFTRARRTAIHAAIW